ncbi:MAG TPA: hypothetical protein ENN28_03805 [Candidatus Uhrbacteria bacterium]|nr:hypothetical protein [Candidatus Uhrbacteria bacterium]
MAQGKVTKGGKPVVLESKKNNPLQKIAQQLLAYAQKDRIITPPNRTEKIFLVHDVAEKLKSLGHNPGEIMPKMIDKGYLVADSKDPENYYVFTVPAQGLRLAPYLTS